MRFSIDGKEIEVEGLEVDSLFIARPSRQLNPKELAAFARNMDGLREVFDRYGITVLCANKDDVTFEILKAVSGQKKKKPWDY